MMMRQAIPAILVVLLMTIGYSGDILLEESQTKMNSTSSLTLSFPNGPDNGDDVTGLLTVTIGVSGSGTQSSMQIEISSDGSNWTEVVNLTTTPWLTNIDTNSYENDSYTLRVRAYDTDVNEHTLWFTSGQFNIVNQVPVITSFSLANQGVGLGTSALERAWYNIPANGTLQFSWTASDDDLSHASLTNVPGPGSPTNDGPTSISYGWSWNTGAISEGTYNPRLTVYDNSGLSKSKTMFIGIDRTAPTMSTPDLSGSNGWSNTETVTISGLDEAADDGDGSGISHIQIKQSDTWINTTDSTYDVTFDEGEHIISMRAVDIVGNVGSTIDVTIKVDTSEPIGIGWNVPELNTSRVGSVSISYDAEDLGSGIDNSSSKIQYGFDLNGVGATPDQSGRWIDAGTSGLEGSVGLASWVTKSRQYLMVRAVITDNAGNEMTTIPSAFQILPGRDFWWNTSQTNLDRLVVRPGDTNGQVVISSVLEINQDFGGDITMVLQAAPADRSENVDWTTMRTITITGSDISDDCNCILITWNYTVPNTGQWDLKLVIDPNNEIDERDEGNNNHYLMVTGATVSGIGAVSSFTPSVLVLMIVGLGIAIYLRRKTILPPN